LTISKQLVEAMGGKLKLESEPNVGSKFFFELTLNKQPLPSQETVPLSPDSLDLRRTRILGVDDNATNRVVLSRMVESMNWRVETVGGGAEALETLRNARRDRDPFHLVLLDMLMPDMDGEQTARAIKSDPSLKDTKIIVLASDGQSGDAARLEAMGCSGYLLKPVKHQSLRKAIVKALLIPERDSDLVSVAEEKRENAKILLAEDNPVNQKLAVALLQKAGYVVDVADTGVKALEMAKNETYRAILMDVQMPEMDGLEATKLIRAWESVARGHVPIIAMTAHAMNEDRERCLRAGMDDYLAKPLASRSLYNALDRWIHQDDGQDYSFREGATIVGFENDLFGESEPRAESKADSDLAAGIDPESPPINYESALFRLGDDKPFLKQMLEEFMDHLPDRLREMNAALGADDLRQLNRLAHNLKGIALNFGADTLANLALSLEEACKREVEADASFLVQQVENEARRVTKYISTSEFERKTQ
jgi:CheY-like chemotaxis protein/HPt (histidine-containing phosphotransfer) domain-containing protein